MKIKKTKLIFSLAALVSMILVGCQGSGTEETAAPKEDDGVSAEEQAEMEAYEKQAGGMADERTE